jgi:serine/threonine protein kinase
MVNYRDNINKKFNLLDYSVCKSLIDKEDMSMIGKGGQGDVFKVVGDKCGSVVLKKLRKDVSKLLLKDGNYDLEYHINREYKMLTQAKILIDYNYCGNVIGIIDFDPKNYYFILEYADGDCVDIIKKRFSISIIYSFLCQALIGLLCIQKLFTIIHNDFKLENILYKKVDENVQLKYLINGTEYKIPTYGYLFMIGDFGLYDNAFNKNNVEFIDTDRLKNSLLETLVKSNKESGEQNNVNKEFEETIYKIGKILENRDNLLEKIKKFNSYIKSDFSDKKHIQIFTFNYK